ncbi:MAG: pyridoxal phosphate-dependent decarboxylase family protein [Gaiella sp.]
MSDPLLRLAAELAIDAVAGVDNRPVAPTEAGLAALAAFDEPLPTAGSDPEQTLRLLHDVAGPATMASTGPHYFGFVTGATYPVALGAAFLASAWDQNTALPVMSPAAAAVHETTRHWLLDLLGLPPEAAIAYVTGATVANAACLASARDALLAARGWDVQEHGLFGAPEIQVVVGAHRHSTLSKSLGLVGLGRSRVHTVPTDDQGRMRADRLGDVPGVDGPVLVCAQAGEVNTGAFDPFEAVADWTVARRGWLHVDGAFGLWALADPTRGHLVQGLVRADSWATDAHKWLNVTYDCGIAVVRDPAALRRTFSAAAGYVPAGESFDAMHHTPQSSQRARQFEVWSVLRTLGRDGVAELVQRSSSVAALIADRLREAGLTILNDVVLNQVLVRLEDAATTEALIAEIQRDRRIWCGPTQWAGGTAMRISVSSWKTTLADGERAATVIEECAKRVRAQRALPA